MRCSKPHEQVDCYTAKSQPKDAMLLMEHQRVQLQRQLECIHDLQSEQMRNNLSRLSSSHLLDNGLSMLQQREKSLQHVLPGLSHYSNITNSYASPNFQQQLLDRISLLQSANLALPNLSSMQTPLINSARLSPELQSLTANGIPGDGLIDNLAGPLPSIATQGLDLRSRSTQYQPSDIDLLKLLHLKNKISSSSALFSTLYDNY